MNALKRKLTSQSGASITYALLLFLVCAVVSSVVLAAGTAASGRMSQSVESDQRYYAVTSAAEFLKKHIDGQKVTLKKTDPKGYIPVESASELLAYSSKTAVLGEKNEKDYHLNVEVSDETISETLVDIKSVIDVFSVSEATPKLTMTITNHPDPDKDNKLFSINLEFTASIEERKEKKTTDVKIVTWNFYRLSVKQAE